MTNLAIDAAGNIWWANSFGNSTGQINVSPTSTPVYLPAYEGGADSSFGAFGLVEWTQPGGFAATAQTADTTQPLTTSLAVTPSTNPSVPSQPVVVLGDTSPNVALPVTPEPDPSPLELWIGDKSFKMAL
jgi:hypothetical protein